MNIFRNIAYFFRFTLPEKLCDFKYWWSELSIVYKLLGVLIVFLSIYLVYTTKQAYEQAVARDNAETAKVKNEAEQKVNVSDKYETQTEKQIVNEGAAKYLRDVMVLNQKQVEDAFNNNAQYHGQYKHVIDHANTLGGITDFRNYLNPIINTIQNGETTKAASMKKDFNVADNLDAVTNQDMDSGVMIVQWDSQASDAQEQANRINNIIHNAKDYKVVVYDKQSNMFSTALNTFLNYGDAERPGFNQSNDWSGTIYGFKNGLFTFHSKSLNNIPDTMPIESLSKPSIKNNNAWKK